MLDYHGEEDFYPYDGDNDNYDSYEPNLGGADFILSRKFSSDAMQGRKDDFVKDPNYYHSWKDFDQIIEREKCYSIRVENVWMNIPKKIVRQIKDNQLLVHTATFYKIETTAIAKQLGVDYD
jgi:hypothetical protein